VKTVVVMLISLLYINILMFRLLMDMVGPELRREDRRVPDPTFMVNAVLAMDKASLDMYLMLSLDEAEAEPLFELEADEDDEEPVPTLNVKTVSVMDIVLLYICMLMSNVDFPAAWDWIQDQILSAPDLREESSIAATVSNRIRGRYWLLESPFSIVVWEGALLLAPYDESEPTFIVNCVFVIDMELWHMYMLMLRVPILMSFPVRRYRASSA